MRKGSQSVFWNSSDRSNVAGTGRSGRSLIIESLFGLVLVVACLAVFVRLFTFAYEQNCFEYHRSQAITLAVNQAEIFAAEPSALASSQDASCEHVILDGYDVYCAVAKDVMDSGVLYKAQISVFYESEDLYHLSTCRYVSNEEGVVN